MTELQAAVASKPQAYVVMYAARVAALLPSLRRFHPRVALIKDHVAVVALVSAATGEAGGE